MVQYPIVIERESYRGPDEKKRKAAAAANEVAQQLEKYINDQLQAQQEPIKIYAYSAIAAATGYSTDLVRRLCFAIDGGSNGFTALRSGLTAAEANAEIENSKK